MRKALTLVCIVLVLLLALVLQSDAQSFVGRFTRVLLNSQCVLRSGSGSPESTVTGNVCDLYLRTDGGAGTVVYSKESGTGNTGWQPLTSSASGAPQNATYITQTANSTLSAEQALSALATGLMQVTTSTGVVSSVTTSAGVSALLSDETGSGAAVFGTSPTIATPDINSNSGNDMMKFGTPSVGSCGTSPQRVGNDIVGKVTVGTTNPGSCVLTFSATWTSAPPCQVTNETTAVLVRATSTTSQVTFTGALVDGDVLAYHCLGF